MRSPFQLSDKKTTINVKERSKSQRVIRKFSFQETEIDEFVTQLPRIRLQTLSPESFYLVPFPFDNVNEQILEYAGQNVGRW